MYRYQIERMRKYYGNDADDPDWDDNGHYIGPKNTLYVWDRNGNQILTISSYNNDHPQPGDKWTIGNADSVKYWNYDKWEYEWDSIEDAIASVRQHKKDVTIKRGVYWDDSNYLEDV